MKGVADLLATGSGIDPALIDWNNPAWENWKSPAQFSGQVRFGEMKVDLAQLTEHVPQRPAHQGACRDEAAPLSGVPDSPPGAI